MNRSRTIRSRSGFTLVEMLVAVTLVLLMMVMFGEIFQIATTSVTKQRTMADNDQNARTFLSVIRADLDKRSYRTVVPFFANEDATHTGTRPGTRDGYFYISNNSNGFSGTPSDGTDDVLQLTVTSTAKVRNADESPYYGRAVALPVNFYQNLNQPDWDDGQANPGDEAGSSSAAEVSYWMRGGKLYRRVMLIRKPFVDRFSPQPESHVPPISDLFLPGGVYSTTTNPIFWRDFDYSANAFPASATPNTFKAVFNGIDQTGVQNYLKNDLPTAPAIWLPSLGQSWNRYGFHHFDFNPPAGGALFYGLPREFCAILPAAPAAPPPFLGRFTHEETSNNGFQYPHSPGNPPVAITNWMAAGNTVTLNADGAVASLANGPRIGVDLLLSHVHEFRVEVWDERLNDFAPMGHTLTNAGGVAGDFHSGRRLNGTFGPLSAAIPPQFGPNILDTWHPRYDRNADGILGNLPDRPPFRPLNFDPTGQSAPPPPSPAPIAGSSVQGYWEPGQAYEVNLGHVIFPRREDLNGNGFLDTSPLNEDGSNGFSNDGFLQENVRIGNEDLNGNGMLDMGEDTNGNMVLDLGAPPGVITEDLNADGDNLDPGEDGAWGFPVGNPGIDQMNLRQPFFPMGLTYAYRCIRSGTSGPTRLNEPNWNTTVGHIIRGNRDIDANNDGDLLDPGDVDYPLPDEPDWIVEYNVRPLRAIRITVRFEHPTARQMKQITIVHSLRDTTVVP